MDVVNESSVERSLKILKAKIKTAKDSSTSIPADKVEKIVEALATVEGFLRRDDVQELFQKTNSKPQFEDNLSDAANGLDVDRLKRDEFLSIIRIGASSVAAGLSVGFLFGLF